MIKNYTNNRKFIRRLIWTVLPAQAISILVANLAGVIDGYVIGNYLEDAGLTAYGIISPFTMLFNAIATIFSAGALIVCGKELGKSNSDNPNKIFSLSLVVAFVFGLLTLLIGIFIPNTISTLLGAKEDVVDLASKYLCGILIGMPLLMIMPILLSFLQYGNDNHILIISASIQAVIKLILNTLFIKLGDNSIFFIGLSTGIANFVAACFLFVRYRINKKLVRFKFSYIDFKFLKSIILFGLPSAVINIMFALRNVFLNKVAISVGGNIAVDSISICSTLGLICVMNSAMATTVAMIASIFSSKEDRKSLESLLFVSFHINVIWNVVGAIVISLLSKEIAIFFGSSNPEITSKAIIYYIISLVSFALPTNTINIYKCLGRINLVNIILSLQCFGYQILGMYILPIFFGLDGLWYNYIVADALTIITFLIIIWIKNKSFSCSFKDSLCFDKNFGSDNQLSLILNKQSYDFVKSSINSLNLESGKFISIMKLVDECNLDCDNEINIINKDGIINVRIRNFNKGDIYNSYKNHSSFFKLNELLYKY